MKRRIPVAPRHLGHEGRQVWAQLHREFSFDPADIVLVSLLCDCAERVALAREQIAREGLVLESGKTRKRHPAVEAERAARAQLLECWRVLRLNAVDADPPKIGRPPSGRKNREMPEWLH
jgi:P27 family predicted phage terminase small subunit